MQRSGTGCKNASRPILKTLYRLAEEVPLSQRHAGHILQSYGEPTIVKPTQSEAEPVAMHEEGGGG